MSQLGIMPVESPERAGTAMTDREAIAGVVRGDRDVFEIIVRRYNAQLYRVGMAYLHDHARTEDAMQNTYVKAFLNLASFRGTAAFSTWLTRIMVNECLMMLRRQRRAPVESLETAKLALVPDPPAAAMGDALDAGELKTLLEKCVADLPRMQRAVYLLREVQNLSTAETAACLQMSRGHVKVLLHRAREQLKKLLLATAAGPELFDYPATFCDPFTARVRRAIAVADAARGDSNRREL